MRSIRTVASAAVRVIVGPCGAVVSLPHPIAKSEPTTSPTDARSNRINPPGVMTLDDTARGSGREDLSVSDRRPAAKRKNHYLENAEVTGSDARFSSEVRQIDLVGWVLALLRFRSIKVPAGAGRSSASG